MGLRMRKDEHPFEKRWASFVVRNQGRLLAGKNGFFVKKDGLPRHHEELNMAFQSA